ESTNNSLSNVINSTITFRPIISKVLSRSILSSTNDNIPQLLYSNTNNSIHNGDQHDYSSKFRSLS
ncbi:unnamed protein product, partial [Rotaria sp. Silwood2]